MKRLVETSGGRIELDVTEQIKRAGGTSVRVVRFDSDGWQVAEGWWSRNLDQEAGSLPEVIERIAGVPPAEAKRIADETLRDFRERGGESEKPAGVLRVVLPTVALAGVGAVALVAFVVWLIVIVL